MLGMIRTTPPHPPDPLDLLPQPTDPLHLLLIALHAEIRMDGAQRGIDPLEQPHVRGDKLPPEIVVRLPIA